MSGNLSKMGITETCSMLNSTPLGTVVKRTRVLEHREAGGMRVASSDDHGKINLAKYAAWMRQARIDKENTPTKAQGNRERMALASRDSSRKIRECGPLPEVADPEKKKSASETSARSARPTSPRRST